MNNDIDSKILNAVKAIRKLGAIDVFLFGSAAHGEIDDSSDVDIAVTGLPPEIFFRAMSEASEILKKQVDLVDLDEDTPFTRHLKEEGELLRVG